MGLEFYSIRFLLLQLHQKIKTAYLVRITVYFNAFDRTLPEGLFVGFIQLQVYFLPVPAKGGQKAVVGA